MPGQKRAQLGVGWKFPLRISPAGGFAYSRYEEDIQEAIWIILSTAKGERQMLAGFGCGIHDYVFAPNNTATQGNLAHEVRLALTEWEPRIDVVEVKVIANQESPNRLLIQIDYRIRSNNAFYNLVYPFFIQEGTGG